MRILRLYPRQPMQVGGDDLSGSEGAVGSKQAGGEEGEDG